MAAVGSAGPIPIGAGTGLDGMLQSRLDSMGESVGRLNQQSPPPSIGPLRPTALARGLPPAVASPPPPPAPPPSVQRGGPARQSAASPREVALADNHYTAVGHPRPQISMGRSHSMPAVDEPHPSLEARVLIPPEVIADRSDLPRLLRGLERGDVSVKHVLARLEEELHGRSTQHHREADRSMDLALPSRGRWRPPDFRQLDGYDYPKDVAHPRTDVWNTVACSRCALREKEEVVLKERDRVMEQLVAAVAQALAGLGASVFNWSLYQDLDDWECDGLSSLVLSYLTPCAHVDPRIADVCSRIQGGIRKALISPEDAAELLRARQRAVDRAERDQSRRSEEHDRAERERLERLEHERLEREAMERERERLRKEQELNLARHEAQQRRPPSPPPAPPAAVQQPQVPQQPQFAFKSRLKNILVRVVSASNLRKADTIGDSDAYVICQPGTRKQAGFTTPAISSQNPQWKYNRIINYELGEPLHFKVYDDDIGRDEMLGTCELSCEAFASNGFKGSINLKNTGGPSSTLQVEIILPIPLRVEIVSASLEAASSAFVIAEVPGRPKFTTSTKSSSQEPVWKEEHEFTGYFKGEGLQFYLHKSQKELVGQASVQADMFYPNGYTGELRLTKQDRPTGVKLRVHISVGALDVSPYASATPLASASAPRAPASSSHNSQPPSSPAPSASTRGSPRRQHTVQQPSHQAAPPKGAHSVPEKVIVEFSDFSSSADQCNGTYILTRQMLSQRHCWHCPANGMYLVFQEDDAWVIKLELSGEDDGECFAYCEDHALLPTEVEAQWLVMDSDDGFTYDPDGGVFDE